MHDFPGKVAIVTGAASGIGRALCSRLAQEGCNLALVDVNERGLAETAAEVKRIGSRASVHVIDVANRSQMEHLPEQILKQHSGIHLLINNAGVSLAGPFESSSVEDWEWIVGINFWGVIYGCKFFLPYLRRETEAHIVNISSDFGLIGLPAKSAYCATKFAVRGFSESLRAELYDSPVAVTCVYPGPVDTGLIRYGRSSDSTKQQLEATFVAERGLAVDRVAGRIVRGIKRGAPRVLIGRETYLIDAMARCCPVWTNSLIARFRRWIRFI